MKHFLIGFLILLSLLAVFRRLKARFFPGTLKVTLFDVGQGDSALVQFPQGYTVLVDAGRGFRNWDVGTHVLVRELQMRSILTLDALLMTHPDQDHSFGIKGVFSELQVKEFWMNEVFWQNPTPLLKERIDLAHQKKINVKSWSEEHRWEQDGVKIQLFPLRVGSLANDNSLVALLEFGSCSVLLTGDIERKGEAFLLGKLHAIDLLKLAHHGSKTSSSQAFLEKTGPKAAIISSGYQNHYGHPHPRVSERLRSFSIETFRTDFHGMVEFESDGRQFTCRTIHSDCGVISCEN